MRIEAIDRLTAFTDTGAVRLEPGPDGTWQAHGLNVTGVFAAGALGVSLEAPNAAVRKLEIRWAEPWKPGTRYLGDHWERGYGDLEWRGLVPERPMPWYLLASHGDRTDGMSVKTGGAALAHWNVDAQGVTLTLDVRCGGMGVRAGERVLEVCQIVEREGLSGETPPDAARELCRLMCPSPRLPKAPVYGTNDWYYSYGNSTSASILEDARRTAEWASGLENRPFAVIDAGWQPGGGCSGGDDWSCGNEKFADMAGLASAIRNVGARPGIWIRPLLAGEKGPERCLLPTARLGGGIHDLALDPSQPEVLERVADDMRRLSGWGYELIKHDFTTVDILGRWGFDMGAQITADGWAFSDRTRTTAEIVRTLYATIREAAGEAILIGCNTIGHLGAGIFELQRTGDDTSGREWERTRKMGVNTLAFRMAQHNTFFAADADCVGLTNDIPWALNRQWLDLLARSGTPLFVSADKEAVGPEQERALKAAFTQASGPQVAAVPLDWLETTCPTRWQFGNEVVEYDWTSL